LKKNVQITNTGWQCMHVDVQVGLVRSAGHAEKRKVPKTIRQEFLVC